jgi:O-antigen biosynthesis protein WbqP
MFKASHVLLTTMKRIFDLAAASAALLILAIPMLVVALMVRMTSRGPALYWSDRIGRYNAIFRMPKFRTMHVNTPPVATHLMRNYEQYMTPIGEFLRKSSIDELPQLLCIIKGDMSFVGPRPALFNQDDLVALRTSKGVHVLTPGLTGWAQINGRDELPIPVKVGFDEHYLHHCSFLFDMKILALTVLKVVRVEGVSH